MGFLYTLRIYEIVAERFYAETHFGWSANGNFAGMFGRKYAIQASDEIVPLLISHFQENFHASRLLLSSSAIISNSHIDGWLPNFGCHHDS